MRRTSICAKYTQSILKDWFWWLTGLQLGESGLENLSAVVSLHSRLKSERLMQSLL